MALIAVVKVPSPLNSGWSIRQWADFVEAFDQKNYGTYTELFKTYLKYVRKICNMAEFEKFNIDPRSLTGLTSIVRMIQRTLETSSTDLYQIRVRKEFKWNFGEDWAGYFFDLTPIAKDVGVSLAVWYGLEFNSDRGPATIAVGLHVGKTPEAFARISENLRRNPIYDIRTEPEFIELRMYEAQFAAINNLPTKEEQLRDLKEFLKVCCEELLRTMKGQKH